MNKKLNLVAVAGFFLSFLLYWLLLSWLDRFVFAISVNSLTEGNFIANFYESTVSGFKLDLSLAGYLLALPFLFFVIQHAFIKKPVSKWWLRGYTMVPTFIFAAITISNIPLYTSWNEKISKRALAMAMETPEGVTASLDFGIIWKSVLILILFFGCAHYFYHLVVVRFAKYKPLSLSGNIILFLVGVGLIFTFIRGGYGRANLNPSIAYYSENAVLNHTAVNTYWAFLKDLTKSTKKSPYNFMPMEEADALVEALYEEDQDSTIRITTNNRPNVVLIILEGLVGQVFEQLGGEKDVTPRMNALMKEGITFTKSFAAADRSDKGIVSVMSGFPGQGPESIIKHIAKHEQLPAITQLYDSLGYATSFYHGGQSEFYNIKSFMFAHGVNRVVDDSDFGLDVKRVSWGVYDHLVANRMLEDLNKETKPLFSIFYTVVNHEPFEMDEPMHFGKDTKANAYRSTAYYTDSVIHDLVEKAKKEDWYDNTLFVVVSDHGHVYPQEKYNLNQPERYHIPLFFFGGALESQFVGQVNQNVVSQIDIAKTLQDVVGIEGNYFKYSRNLFTNHKNHFAFINSNNTFGVITNDQSLSYDIQGEKVAYIQDVSQPKAINEEWLHKAKAFYQVVFQDFTNY